MLAALLGALRAHAAPVELPPEHTCPTFAGLPDRGSAQDAAPARVTEGMVLTRADALRLSPLLPPEVWRHRDVFFHDGMRMVIGACHRRYPPPRAYRAATEHFAGQPTLDGDANLAGYTAGLPFPPASIDLAAADAGARCVGLRAATRRGPIRAVPDRRVVGDAATRRPRRQLVQVQPRTAPTSRRPLPRPGPPRGSRAAGPQTPPAPRPRVAATLRSRRAAVRAADDVFNDFGHHRRCGRSGHGSTLACRATARPAVSSAPVGVAAAASVTENLARGLTGLSIRPNAYVWRVLGVREVVAPLNAAREGYPGDPERNFGPGGLSLGDDRWDVRQAVAIQGALRERRSDGDWLTLYIDSETLQPLYVISERRSDHRVGVGILLHRWSGDLAGYPAWSDGEPAAVFDPAAAVFFDERDGSGWRRESYDAHSMPLAPDELRYRASSAFTGRPRLVRLHGVAPGAAAPAGTSTGSSGMNGNGSRSPRVARYCGRSSSGNTARNAQMKLQLPPKVAIRSASRCDLGTAGRARR
jgi:hypothetical protein